MDHQSQTSIWRDLPEDLLLKILRNMALTDIWACRSRTRAWSVASASLLDVHFDVHVSVKDLHCKLRQILQQKPRDTHCTVQVTQPLQLSQLHEILGELKHQGMEVIVCLAADHRRPKPNPDDLRKLAPMLNAFSHTSSASGQRYSTPGWMHLLPRHTHILEKDVVDDSSRDDETQLGPRQKLQFRLRHLQALLPACKTLEMLCISACAFSLDGLSSAFFQNCSAALAAIPRMAALQTLCMSVKQITMLEAVLLGGLSNPQSIQLCIRGMVSGGVLEMLSSGHAHIQLLSLHSLPLSAVSSLKPWKT